MLKFQFYVALKDVFENIGFAMNFDNNIFLNLLKELLYVHVKERRKANYTRLKIIIEKGAY